MYKFLKFIIRGFFIVNFRNYLNETEKKNFPKSEKKVKKSEKKAWFLISNIL